MSKNRSPREVCSMTDGMIRFDGGFISGGSLTAGGPEFHVGLLLFLVGCPKLIARLGELTRDSLHLGGYAVERVSKPEIVAQLLVAPGLTEADERFLGVVADQLGLLAHEALDLLVRNLDLEPLGDGVEHELARNRAGGLVAEAREQLLRRLPGHRQIRVERDAARLDLSGQGSQQFPGPRI